jgi:4-hydroxy-2-oxoheptanedioate aldolase
MPIRLDERTRGVFLKLPSNQVIEAAAVAGFDFVIVDLEHSQLLEREAIGLVEHARTVGIPAMVRVPAADRGQVNRLLEAGAAGIQLSTVRTARQVRELRDAMGYPPHGTRSISLSHSAARFGALPLAEYLAQEAANPPRLVAQIETATTDDPLAAILAEQPDVAFIGTADLSVDLGLDAERVRARIDEIAAAAAAADVPLGAFGLGGDARVVYDVVSSDLALLAGALKKAAAPPS